jgi:hypothetical protein
MALPSIQQEVRASRAMASSIERQRHPALLTPDRHPSPGHPVQNTSVRAAECLSDAQRSTLLSWHRNQVRMVDLSCRCGRVAFRARTPARSGPDPDQGPPLVLPASGRRAGVQHPVQLRQLIPVQPAPGRLPLRRQARRSAGLPGTDGDPPILVTATAANGRHQPWPASHGRPASLPVTLGLPPTTGQASRTVTRNTARRGPGRGLGAGNSQHS